MSDEAFCGSICPLKRSIFNIIWSCLATVLICSWTSVHPNIPARNEWLARANRLRLMFWMIVAPELVLAWAIRQFFAARKIRDKYNERTFKEGEGWKKWTMVHGHFFGMGGFTVVDSSHVDDDPKDGSQDGEVLTLREYETCFKNDRDFSIPTLTDDELKDRSKADALAKSIAFLQTLLFLLQCLARHHQGLVLTELELVTVALASLNFFTYAIWWDKPLDVKEPIKIYFPRNQTPTTSIPSTVAEPEAPTVAGDSDLSVRHVISEALKLLKESLTALCGRCIYPKEYLKYLFLIFPSNTFFIVTFPVYVLFPMDVVLLLRIIETKQVDVTDDHPRLAARMLTTLRVWRHDLSSSVSDLFTRWYEVSFQHRGSTFYFAWFLLFPVMFFLLLLFIVFHTLFSLVVFFLSFVFNSAFNIVTTRETSRGAPRVPPFYALETKSDNFSRMLVFAFFGFVFGGIHLFGWNLTYPTGIERILWRATSLTITIIPFAVAPIDFLLENVSLNGRFGKRVRDGLDFIMTILLVIYVLARLSLIAQALVLLRDQPLQALLVVDWTKYTPSRSGWF